jgi:secreted trypsin-like serine protease
VLQGDSGVALVIQESDGIFTEVGVVSFGAAAGCQRGFPFGFARVTSFLIWISSVTGLSFPQV